MRLVLFQPDIPQNVGAAIRLAACFDVALDLIEPFGFALTDTSVRRAAMDYGDLAQVRRHVGWRAYLASEEAAAGRLILLTTGAQATVYEHRFASDDRLLFGRESAGVPPDVKIAADAALAIPLAAGARSLNVVTAAAVALGQARRLVPLARPEPPA